MNKTEIRNIARKAAKYAKIAEKNGWVREAGKIRQEAADQIWRLRGGW